MAESILPNSGIYSIRNVVSGRVYVGSAIDIRKRWHTHRFQLTRGRHHSKPLQSSWTKHGPETFTFEIIEATGREELIAREQYWIDTLNAACPRRGFNICRVAGSCLGVKASPEARLKMSAAHHGKKLPPRTAEHREKIAAAARGRKASPTVREKMSADRKGRKMSMEARAKMRDAALGKKASAATRAKISAAKKGKTLPPFTDEHRAKIGASRRSRPLSPAAMNNLRAAVIASNKRRGLKRHADQIPLPFDQ